MNKLMLIASVLFSSLSVAQIGRTRVINYQLYSTVTINTELMNIPENAFKVSLQHRISTRSNEYKYTELTSIPLKKEAKKEGISGHPRLPPVTVYLNSDDDGSILCTFLYITNKPMEFKEVARFLLSEQSDIRDDCMTTCDIIVDYKPVPNNFKDYLSRPSYTETSLYENNTEVLDMTQDIGPKANGDWQTYLYYTLGGVFGILVLIATVRVYMHFKMKRASEAEDNKYEYVTQPIGYAQLSLPSPKSKKLPNRTPITYSKIIGVMKPK